MKRIVEIVGIIPVKANSERVWKKNLRKFANTNLYELKLEQLKKTKNFKNFVVSSEDKKVLEIAEKKILNPPTQNFIFQLMHISVFLYHPQVLKCNYIVLFLAPLNQTRCTSYIYNKAH